jgi:thiamine biosynthesis lipoprotein
MERMTEEYSYAGKIFGTNYNLAILHTDIHVANRLAEETVAEMRTYERRCSRFLPESELSILNRTKSLVVSQGFFDVVVEAKKLYLRTQGTFNPLVQVSELGYQQSRNPDGTIIPGNTIPHLNYDTNFTAVTIDPTTSHITLGSDQKIDLGGILKGYLAEKIAKHLCTIGNATGCIVNIGGDLATYGNDADGLPFACSIYNPLTDTDTTPIPLINQSLATSGTYKRSWVQNEHTTHHIIDPSTHVNPTTAIISASIIHEHGAVAEAFTKVFLITGIVRGLEILQDETYSYYLIATDGTITTNITTL